MVLKPSISVIVPVYNAEKYLRRCLDSILAQTFSDFELLLVDDGSTDGSGKILDEYTKRDGRAFVIHQANGGELAARASGIKRAKGEWLYFVDADDAVQPDALISMFDCINPKTDIVVFESGYDCIYSPAGFAEALLNCRHWTVWGKLYRKILFDDYVTNIPQKFKVGGDFLTNLKVCRNLHGEVVCRPQRKYIYTVGSASSVQTQHKYDYEYERAMVLTVDEIVKLLPQNETVKKALFRWKCVWLGGMIGLRYSIDYSDQWIKDLEKESRCHILSLRERIVIKAIASKNLRWLLVLEKKLKSLLRKLLRR